MTDLKFNLLGMLYSANPIYPLRECDLVNSGLGTAIEIGQALSDLHSCIDRKIGSDIIVINSLGRDAYEQAKEERQCLSELEERYQKQLKALQSIADSAVLRAELAQAEARTAKKDAKFSKIVSVLSLIVGFGSLVVAVIALVLG